MPDIFAPNPATCGARADAERRVQDRRLARLKRAVRGLSRARAAELAATIAEELREYGSDDTDFLLLLSGRAARRIRDAACRAD